METTIDPAPWLPIAEANISNGVSVKVEEGRRQCDGPDKYKSIVFFYKSGYYFFHIQFVHQLWHEAKPYTMRVMQPLCGQVEYLYKEVGGWADDLAEIVKHKCEIAGA